MTAAGLSLQTFVALNPNLVVSLFSPKGQVAEESESEHQHQQHWESKFRDILRRVGVRNADKVTLVETDNFGPTTVGCDLPFIKHHAVVFVPKVLLQAAEYSDRELTEEDRLQLVTETGTLYPTEREMDYILGHEAAHLAKNHSLKSSAVGLASLSISFGFLSLLASQNKQQLLRTTTKRLLSSPSTLLGQRSIISLASTAAVIGLVSLLQEKEADITSATRLDRVREASELVEKKRLQNLWLRHQAGDSVLKSFVSANGNNLLEWEHPSLTWQQSYLQRLQQQHHERAEHLLNTPWKGSQSYLPWHSVLQSVASSKKSVSSL